MTNFPEAADDATNLPDVTGWDQSGHNVTTGDYDENRVHSRFLDVIRTAILAIQAKLGAGASTPVADRLLRGTALGVSEWVADSTIPADNWGHGTGTPGQALSVKDDGTGLEFSSRFGDDLQAHLDDAEDSHDASAVSSVPTGTLSATNVQAALNELDTEKETPAGAQAKVAAHEADTTNVHGIANTAALETQTGAQTKIDAAIAALVDSSPSTLNTLNELAAALADDPNFATTVTNQIAGVQDNLDDHEADTTDVHGIANTALLETQTGAQTKATAAQTAAETTAATALADHADNLGAGAHVSQQAAIADLVLVVTDPPTQAEVQAVADKIDDILAALRAGGQLAT